MIPDQVSGRAGHGDAFGQEAHLQFAQSFLTAPVSEGNQGVYKDPPLYGIYERLFNLSLVKAENNNLNTLFCLLNGFDQWRRAGARLDDEFQSRS